MGYFKVTRARRARALDLALLAGLSNRSNHCALTVDQPGVQG